jgi:hypothetical protein
VSDQVWFDYIYDFASLDTEIVILRRGGWSGHKRIEDMPWRQFSSMNRPNTDAADARRIVALLNGAAA